MLYKDDRTKPLSEELFKNPTKEYRGTPFWSWNTKINKKHVDDTLSELKQMGMGGAHIHCRTGMNLPYLGDEFMDMVKYAHKVANDNDMLTWLYDEDRWPSGAAGGIVTKDEQYRMRFLVLSPDKLPEDELSGEVTLESSAKAVRSGKRKFLAKYAIKLEDSFLKNYEYLKKEEEAKQGYDVWYAYLEISGDSAWFNNQAYLNTLDKASVDRFIEVTHEAYYNNLGEHFGDSIPAIFTDEPQFSYKTMLGFANSKEAVTIPYTDDFEESYIKSYGDSFLFHLPEVIWDLPNNEVSVHRYRYHDHVCERFTNAFADNVGSWCKEHNIMLTGHMMHEPSLHSQTLALGEAMRSYRAFGLPGIDMLCDSRELTTAKQAQSASHQYDCPGVLSEIYGVTNWDFDFRRHKLAGDWQAALGVTVRVHHLTWTSMAGEAKRDYPAAIGYQSPWYKEYPYIEDYFARINTALTRGKADVKVGVIHPIESYWLYWGTKENTDGIRNEMDNNFDRLVKWLLYGLIDFDFISESLLPELQSMEDAQSESTVFKAGAMNYDVIIVPNCVTLRSTTLNRLKEFAAKGGKVIFTGTLPSYVDAVPSDEAKELANECITIGFNQNDLLNKLMDNRSIDVRYQSGERTSNIIYQMRNDMNGKWLFITHCERPWNMDVSRREHLNIWIKGLYKLVKYNGMTGEITPCDCTYNKGRTFLNEVVYDFDSLLYYLEPIESVISDKKEDSDVTRVSLGNGDENNQKSQQMDTKGKNHLIKTLSYPAKLPVTLSEPNILLLDMAEYRFDEGEWMPCDEILRIDNMFRDKLGYPMRTEAFAQPWVDTRTEINEHKLSLRYQISTEFEVIAPKLALENAEQTQILLNGQAIPTEIVGWYTDRDIKVAKLNNLKPGENILEVIMPFYSKFNVEYMYLLGDFSVSVAGRTASLTKFKPELTFGDICMQGLPFYGGNITYEIPIHAEAGELNIEISQFRCPVIKVALDDEEKGHIALAPYRLNLGKVSEGDHVIKVTMFGNRVNTFGTIHNCNNNEYWCGPNAWRTSGTTWAYEYQLKKSGILVSPVISLAIE